DAGLVIHAGVEEDIPKQMIREWRLLELLRESSKAGPMVRHRAAAMRNHEAQLRKVVEEIRGQALHERGRVGVEIMRPRRVEARIAARAHMNNRRAAVL